MTEIAAMPTLQSMKRQMTWLVAPCPVADAVALKGGLLPESPEVSKMEHDAAHKTLNLLTPVANEVALAAALASDVVTDTKVVTQQLVSEDEDEERMHLRLVVGSTSAAVIAFLLELGVLTTGPNRIVGIE